MNRLIQVLKPLLFAVLATLGWAIADEMQPLAGIGIAIGSALILVVALFRPLPALGLSSRVGIILALVWVGPLAIASVVMPLKRERIEALKGKDNAKYLTGLKGFDRKRWLEEAKTLDPKVYDAERARLDAETIAEAARKKADEDARTARERAEEGERRRQRIAALEAQLTKLGDGDLAAKTRAYRELAELDPTNAAYRKAADDFGARWETERVAEYLTQRQRTNPEDFVHITTYSWGKVGFDMVAEATLTIKNDLSFAVKDIALICQFSAPSGTLLSSATPTLYEILPAKKARTFREVSVGFVPSQADRMACAVLSAKPVK